MHLFKDGQYFLVTLTEIVDFFKSLKKKKKSWLACNYYNSRQIDIQGIGTSKSWGFQIFIFERGRGIFINLIL